MDVENEGEYHEDLEADLQNGESAGLKGVRAERKCKEVMCVVRGFQAAPACWQAGKRNFLVVA